MTIDKATLDTLGFIMTVSGIVLSVVALLLSILFYRWADENAKASERTLTELKTTTAALQTLVTTLTQESFNLLKSAYTDMGELAKFGVRRDSSDRVVMTPLAHTSPRITRRNNKSKPKETSPKTTDTDEGKGDAAKHSKDLNGVVPLMSNDDLQRITLTFGSHMMDRRGSSFTSALEEAQRLIDQVMDKHPDGAVITTEEFAKELEPYGFDAGEVAYALAVLTATGPIERDEKK